MRVPILMYHRLGEVRPKSIVPGQYVAPRLFDRQLRTLRALRMTTISLNTMQNAFERKVEMPKRPVVITFDDGYASFASLGLPSLKKQEMVATVFLVSDLVGGRNEWDLAKGDVEERLMSREQILKAQEDGIEFGSHTRRHVALTEVPHAVAEEEIRRSKQDLERWLGRDVAYFCYPYGDESAAVRTLVREAGYRGATNTRLYGNGPDTDPYQWGRINVRHNHTAFRLMRRLLKTRRR